MSLKNCVWYGLFSVGLGMALMACAPIMPAAAPTAPVVATAVESSVSESSAPSWINLCDVDPVDGGTISFAIANPAMVSGTWLNNGMTNDPFLFSQLTDLSIDDASTIVPDVADSWEESSDGLVYTYHLRPDVVWHDGEPLTAADVKWTIELYAHPDSEVTVLSLLPLSAILGYAEFRDGSADQISGVKVVDDNTLQITLADPRADFLYGMSGMNLWPKHYFAGMSYKEISASPKVREQVIGSGPFKMASYEPDAEYVLEANDDYFLGRPHLDRLIFRIGLYGSAAWLPALEKDDLQVGGRVDHDNRAQVEANPDLLIVGAPTPGPTAIWPNHQHFPDKRVLQALLYALDRETIRASVYGPTEAVVFNFANIDPQQTWISAGVAQYGYDPDKATQLLKDAGWDSNHELTLISYAKSNVEKDVLAAMQQYWANVGVKVNVMFMDEADWMQSIFANLDFDLAYDCCGLAIPSDYADYSCANVPPNGINTSAYCNVQVDTLVLDAMTEVIATKRQALWLQVGDITNDEMLQLPLFQLVSGDVINKNVCDFQFREWTKSVWPERSPETWFLRPGS